MARSQMPSSHPAGVAGMVVQSGWGLAPPDALPGVERPRALSGRRGGGVLHLVDQIDKKPKSS